MTPKSPLHRSLEVIVALSYHYDNADLVQELTGSLALMLSMHTFTCVVNTITYLAQSDHRMVVSLSRYMLRLPWCGE